MLEWSIGFFKLMIVLGLIIILLKSGTLPRVYVVRKSDGWYAEDLESCTEDINMAKNFYMYNPWQKLYLLWIGREEFQLKRIHFVKTSVAISKMTIKGKQ